jgi:hypothetical protein
MLRQENRLETVYEGKACRVGDRVRGVYLERYPFAGTVVQVEVLPGEEYHGETWVKVEVDEPFVLDPFHIFPASAPDPKTHVAACSWHVEKIQ